MKSYRTNSASNKQQLTRRDFLGSAGRGAGLAGMALAGGLYVPRAYAEGNYEFPEYFKINPNEFSSTANLYPGSISPGVQYSNPRLASKSELNIATPSYRKLEEGRYGPAKSDILLAQATKELFDELDKYVLANGIGFVGERDFYLQLLSDKPEFAKLAENEKIEKINNFIGAYDITPYVSDALLNRKYLGSSSMSEQMSESLR